MNDLSPINVIEETNFHNAWVKAIRFCYNQGNNIKFGNISDIKCIKDSCQLISLTGNAIQQILDKEIHPLYPFKQINQYCDEYTRQYLKTYLQKSLEEKFSYLYFDRLVNYDTIDQLSIMKDQLQEQIQTNITSNRCQAITWHPEIDLKTDNPPCLQSIQVRYIGNNKVDVHWHFRSRDLITAWQANVIAITECINNEIIPNNCIIARIVDYSDSLHIYDSMIDIAKEARFVPITQWPY